MSIYALPIKVTEVPNTKEKRLIKGLTCGVEAGKQEGGRQEEKEEGKSTWMERLSWKAGRYWQVCWEGVKKAVSLWISYFRLFVSLRI